MKRIYTTLLGIILTVSLLAQSGWRDKEMEVKIFYNGTQQYETLKNLNLQGEYYQYQATLYLTPKELASVENLGLKYEILIKDLNEFSQNFWQDNNRAAYHSYQEIVDLADSLATNCSDICMKILYGLSYEGREVGALKISDSVTFDQAEAEVFFDAGIHGNEIGGPENVIRFARHLCTEYGIDPAITDLIDNREIWILYMVNPDGRENDVRYNANGVDLNRDWGYMWDGEGNSLYPYSQDETRYLRECMYNNQFVVHTTYHSGTEYISCPWSYRYEQPPDHDHIQHLAGIYSSVSGYANMPYGQGSSGMYPINGATKDGNYGSMGSISWSMEISNDKHPPASQIMMYYNYNVPSMIAMIEYSGYGIEGTVTNSVSGEPVEAAIFVDELFPVYSDSTMGDYHKYITAGTYNITAVANGYESQTAFGVSVQDLAVTITDFALVPKDTARMYIYKLPLCVIPNNNYDDEGNTKAIIGAPDGINYSLGKNGYIVIDMQEPIPNTSGTDIKIYEGDDSEEGYTLYAGQSIDGPWYFVGYGNGTQEFELDLSGLSEAQFFRIKDDGNGSASGNDAGFDLDAASDLEHFYGTSIVMYSNHLNDTISGNGNGWVDIGETVDLVVEIGNNGNLIANNTIGTLTSTSPYITIDQATASYGNLSQGQHAVGTYTFTADPSTQGGELAEFTLTIHANGGLYSITFPFQFYIGKIPILIVDLDGNLNSGTVMEEVFQDIDLTYEYKNQFPFGSLDIYESVFVCLGVYDQNHVLTLNEGTMLENYLNHGGKLYMEGGDTWAYDNETPVHPLFGIYGIDDGEGDLDIILGQDGTFGEGLEFDYVGDNAYIDRMTVNGSDAFALMKNLMPSYINCIGNDPIGYRTVGSSFEFGGIEDTADREEWMYRILEFFGGIITEIDENLAVTDNNTEVNCYPNPFSDHVSFKFELKKESVVKINILNQHGQLVNTILDNNLNSGNHTISWNAKDMNGRELTNGIYYYRLTINSVTKDGKLVFMK